MIASFHVFHMRTYVLCCCGVFFQVIAYIRAVNDIYDKVDFDGIKLINFKVKSLKVCVSVSAQTSKMFNTFLATSTNSNVIYAN